MTQKINLTTDLLKIGIKREKQAQELYRELAEKATDDNSRNFFKQLEKEEAKHQDALELEMLKSGTTFKDDDEKAIEYDLAEIDENIDILEGVLLAIGKEKAAFRFYVELATIVQDKNSRETCMELAEEEARHKALLEIEYNRLSNN